MSTIPETQRCQLSDLSYGANVWAYFKINDDGTPQFDHMDENDLAMAVREPYNELYECDNCGEQYPDFEAAKAHLGGAE